MEKKTGSSESVVAQHNTALAMGSGSLAYVVQAVGEDLVHFLAVHGDGQGRGDFFPHGGDIGGQPGRLAKDGHIFVAEQDAIQQFAAMGPGIFVGHCACEALKKHKNVIRVFIRNTNIDDKSKRITQDYGISPTNAESTRKQYDQKRAHYYHANTGKRWDDLSKYDIVLDSGVLGIDGCVAALKGLL